MHNMTWLRMLTMRQAVLLTGREDAKSAEYALANAGSTEGFDEMKGDTSWGELKPILRAQIVSLQGDSSQAVALYQQYLAAAGAPSRLQANLLADKAWCHVQLHQNGDAAATAELAIASLVDETQIDDRAAAHSRLAQVFAALGDMDQHRHHLELARGAWETHMRMQAKVLELFAGMDERGNNS
jgi:hypothetical protein